MKLNETQCLTKGCGIWAKTRGLCPRCYTIASGLVRDKKYTWEQLEKMKLANPKIVKVNLFMSQLKKK